MKIYHCSYHKCLTVYYFRIFSSIYNKIFIISDGYRHFNSLLDEFYRESWKYKIASINNHTLDLQLLGNDFRISRFIRDPRDLVVSGYFYHKRGAEPWCNVTDPSPDDWQVVNGHLPEGMGKGHSFSSYLQSLSTEEGLLAEIDFRKYHFESMRGWPVADSRIKTYRYEDVLGNERAVFLDMFSFYGLPWVERKLGTFLAHYFSAKKQTGKTRHIRNARSNQWKEYFTPKVNDYFERHFSDILDTYGYS